MTPAEKTKELVDKMQKTIFSNVQPTYMYSGIEGDDEAAKACAIIAVDEILGQLHVGNLTAVGEFGRKFQITYWKSVKEEIQKL